MIPFARVLRYGNEVIPIDKNILLDIDFSRQSLNDRTVKDWSSFERVFNLSSGYSAGTVVYDSVLGSNVLSVAGGTQYICSNNLSLNTIDFDLEITFKNTFVGSARTCTGTGMWGNQTRNPGCSWVVNTAGTGDNGCYMWFDRGATTGTQFLRAAMPTPAYVAGTWETVKISVNRISGVTVYRQSTNTSLHYAYYAFGAGVGYYVGGVPGHSPAIAFQGSISKIKITKTGE